MLETTPIEIRSDNYFAAFPHWVLDLRLSSSAIHLYIALLSFANWETKMGRPSRQTLATLMDCSIKTVDRAKDELVEKGLLIYVRRPNTSNFYTVVTANPHRDKNDTSKSGSDKNDTSGRDKNDTLTRVNNYIKTAEPSGSRVSDLVALYMDSYVGELRPNGGQVGNNIKRAVSMGMPIERIAELIPGIAMAGKELSPGTLRTEARLQSGRKDSPTPTPPRYVPEERPEAVPMPENFRELFKAAIENRQIPD